MNTITTNIGGRELIIETGRLAKQADGAVVVTCGGTVVLVTAVMSDNFKEDQDFFPLTVDYRERRYAAGKIPGGFFKRESRPSDKETLTSRLIDRPLRPLFQEGLVNEVQIIATVLSSDIENDSDILAIIGASAALSISDIPFLGPIGAVRVGYIKDKFVINPTITELKESVLDLVVVGTTAGVSMIEAGAKEVDPEVIVKAIDFAQDYIKELIEAQNKLAAEVGNSKREVPLQELDKDLCAKVNKLAKEDFQKIKGLKKKEEQSAVLKAISNMLTEKIGPDTEDNYSGSAIRNALENFEKDEMRRIVLEENQRIDGRAFDEIRPISCEVSALPRTHGSAIFTRGETQSLGVVTLGTRVDEQRVDALEGEYFKRFMLHYNFPPFSVGEVKFMRGPSRRDIGHGALAERALSAVMPAEEDFPYTVRVVSDILESNGSSSMASVCVGSLSLMDAGVPIKKPVSGIAMGMVKEGEQTAILTDIAGMEDHYGDMD
ncbi:MAG: polyribonucleotide nucleotidyltransferase, partial [Candidatus Omnitrophica bacterium]|nr:polyribonucleotide nucleotidyltransferase [Candidatus Omnitrophota bacterium]